MTLVNIGPFVEKTVPAALQITFVDSTGAAIPLTGLTVKFVYWPVNGTSGTERDGTLVDAANGVAKYAWVAGDMVAGSYQGRMYAYTGSTVRYSSDTYCWIVEDDPASPAAFS